MNGAMREKRAYWIGGTIIAFLGVALVRLVAPELEGAYGSLALVVGFALVAAGITIIGFATRRKGSEAFVTAAKGARGGERP